MTSTLEPGESFVTPAAELVRLPEALTHDFHDSMLELVSYSPDGAVIIIASLAVAGAGPMMVVRSQATTTTE